MLDVTQCQLFSGLSEKELKQIGKSFSEVSHPAGHKVMGRGTRGVSFMVILDGEVEVHTGDGRTLPLRRGDHFGEMAMLDKKGRSADVIAKTPVRLAALSAWGFQPFLADHPDVAYRLLQTLATRLREAQGG
jgi:CRP/FNR family cyclic AMP-dependent transcriptional regulator